MGCRDTCPVVTRRSLASASACRQPLRARPRTARVSWTSPSRSAGGTLRGGVSASTVSCTREAPVPAPTEQGRSFSLDAAGSWWHQHFSGTSSSCSFASGSRCSLIVRLTHVTKRIRVTLRVTRLSMCVRGPLFHSHPHEPQVSRTFPGSSFPFQGPPPAGASGQPRPTNLHTVPGRAPASSLHWLESQSVTFAAASVMWTSMVRGQTTRLSPGAWKWSRGRCPGRWSSYLPSRSPSSMLARCPERWSFPGQGVRCQSPVPRSEHERAHVLDSTQTD